MDVYSLKPGQDFNDLKPGYVVFICTFDPFGKGLYRYTFEERCLERDIALGDGTRKIFLSTKGKNDAEVPKELIHFLGYMENSTDEYVSQVTDDSIIRLHDRITELKKRRELEAQYMTFEELLRNRESKGRSAGKAEDILELLDDCGTISKELKQEIMEETDLNTLTRWLKLAAKVSTIEEFISQM